MPANEHPEAAGTLPLLSVIIPTLNEEAALPALLADLGRQRGISLEVLIGDGGSTDGTEAATRTHGAVFVPGLRGRGAQMNAAAAQANGAYLLFLHADSRLEDPDLLARGLACLRQAEQEQPWVAGHFRLRFSRSDARHDLAYRYLEAKTGLNRPGTTNGDQGCLLSRTFFDRLGGFDDSLPFLEDQRLADRVRTLGRWITLPGVLVTSARRFESEGFHGRYLLMGIMMGMYGIGEWRFFARAPGVYRVQEATGRLLLTPIFGLLWSMVRRDWGLAGTVRTFYHLGRVLRQNSWQPFLFLDVWLGPVLGTGRYPLLRLHDRLVAPCLDFRVVDGLAGLLCFCWYMGVLATFYWAKEGVGAPDGALEGPAMRPNPATVVVLFVRLPVPGRVKTRLAAGMGAEGACHLYQAMVADILGALENCGLPIHLWYDEGDDWAVPQAWRDAAARVQRQRGGDIGERMAVACIDCFAAGSDQTILIGSDIPDLDSGTIQATLAALATHDAVLAPAVDGGYGLIALKRARFRPEVFEAVPWSSGDVLRITRQRFADCGLNVGLLPELRDIDTLDDLRAYWQSPHPAAAHTNRTIARLLGTSGPGGRSGDGSFFSEFP